MNNLTGTLILIGLIVVACVIYIFYKLSKNPQSDRCLIKGNNLVKEKKFDKAIQQYLKAISVGKFKQGSVLSAYNNICSCYIEKHDNENAVKYAKLAMNKSSTDIISRILYGKLLYDMKNYNEALAFYEDNKTLAEFLPISYSMEALTYAQLGDEKNANIAINNAERAKYKNISGLKKDVKSILNK